LLYFEEDNLVKDIVKGEDIGLVIIDILAIVGIQEKDTTHLIKDNLEEDNLLVKDINLEEVIMVGILAIIVGILAIKEGILAIMEDIQVIMEDIQVIMEDIQVIMEDILAIRVGILVIRVGILVIMVGILVIMEGILAIMDIQVVGLIYLFQLQQ